MRRCWLAALAALRPDSQEQLTEPVRNNRLGRVSAVQDDFGVSQGPPPPMIGPPPPGTGPWPLCAIEIATPTSEAAIRTDQKIIAM
jgi:hypothetical protein